MSESHRRAQRLLRTKASSGTRILKERAGVAATVANARTGQRLREVAKPNNPSKAMRRVGVALLMSPDPVTDIPGAIILGASFAAKRREPLSAASVSDEIRKLMSEIRSSLRRI